jgi:hypothetical protein
MNFEISHVNNASTGIAPISGACNDDAYFFNVINKVSIKFLPRKYSSMFFKPVINVFNKARIDLLPKTIRGGKIQ